MLSITDIYKWGNIIKFLFGKVGKSMTILEMMSIKNENNKLMVKAFEIIKDNYTNFVNDNYELGLDSSNELVVKIPSLEKRNEYVSKSIIEYEYPLIMCMRIAEMRSVESYEYILAKFLELYKDKLELYLKDVKTIDSLMGKIVSVKNNIDNTTYVSLGIVVIGVFSLGLISNISPMMKGIIIIGMIVFSVLSLGGQFTREKQVKKIIDAYLSVIKTEWYKKQLQVEYAFLCNYVG